MVLQRLIATAPLQPATDELLNQVVSWSSEGKPFTFRQFLVSRMPVLAEELGLKEIGIQEQIKRVEELDEEELKEVACARLQAEEEVIKQIKANTRLGRRFVQAAKQSIALFEGLAENGKIVPP